MSNTSTSTNSSIIVNVNEFEFLKGANYLTEKDIEDIILHKTLIEKIIDDAIRNIRFGMINLQFKSKEDVSIQINTLISLRNGLDKTLIGYKQYMEDKEKPKEIKEIEFRTKQEKREDDEVMKIKKMYHI